MRQVEDIKSYNEEFKENLKPLFPLAATVSLFLCSFVTAGNKLYKI